MDIQIRSPLALEVAVIVAGGETAYMRWYGHGPADTSDAPAPRS